MEYEWHELLKNYCVLPIRMQGSGLWLGVEAFRGTGISEMLTMPCQSFLKSKHFLFYTELSFSATVQCQTSFWIFLFVGFLYILVWHVQHCLLVHMLKCVRETQNHTLLYKTPVKFSLKDVTLRPQAIPHKTQVRHVSIFFMYWHSGGVMNSWVTGCLQKKTKDLPLH